MTELLPIVLVPGLLTSPRLYAEQLPTLWQHGPVTIANNTRDHTIAFEVSARPPTGWPGWPCSTPAPARTRPS